MSAIWGCIDLSGKALPEDLCALMEQPLHRYQIDRFAALSNKNVVMGCGIQYIHKESEREPLPIYDAEAGIYFTADVHIYNREELVCALCPNRGDIPDGTLFFLAYLAWGPDCVKRIYGSYSYAAYDITANELVLGADHTISRSIYYQQDGTRVYFSTLTSPVIEGRRALPRLNETWCAYFLSMPSYAIMTNGTDTPFAGIFRVPAAHYYRFKKQHIRKVRYWFPETTPPLRLASDEEYERRFRALFEQCTMETLRVQGGVAVRLSSGFDSGAVAAYAARLLAQRGQPLRSYTHIPVQTFSRENNRRILYNEKEGVLRFCAMHPNIIPKFLDTPDRNAVLSLAEVMGRGLFPVKSTTNIGWIDGLLQEMHQDGCRVSLGGQYGNVTISRGSMETYLTTVLSQGRLIHFVTALTRYSRIMGYSRKRVLGYILSRFVPLFVRRLLAGDYLKDSIVNREFAQMCKITSKDRHLESNLNITPKPTFQEEQRYLFDETPLAHVSDSETKLTLYHGIESFDVTRDPRIIEFCYSLPMECFSNAGPETRRLSRIYLSDLYPPEVRAEKSPRGSQSSDTIERLITVWEQAYIELKRVCLSPQMLRMANGTRVREILDQIQESPEGAPLEELKKLIYVYSMGVFLEGYEWQE